MEKIEPIITIQSHNENISGSKLPLCTKPVVAVRTQKIKGAKVTVVTQTQ